MRTFFGVFSKSLIWVTRVCSLGFTHVKISQERKLKAPRDWMRLTAAYFLTTESGAPAEELRKE